MFIPWEIKTLMSPYLILKYHVAGGSPLPHPIAPIPKLPFSASMWDYFKFTFRDLSDGDQIGKQNRKCCVKLLPHLQRNRVLTEWSV